MPRDTNYSITATMTCRHLCATKAIFKRSHKWLSCERSRIRRSIKLAEIYADYRPACGMTMTKGAGTLHFWKFADKKDGGKMKRATTKSAWWRGRWNAVGTYIRTHDRRSHFVRRVLLQVLLFLLLFGPSSFFLPLFFLSLALLGAKYAAESLYHHGCSNNRGLTVPAIYCGHIFILTLIATWYRPRAWLESVRSC